MTTFVITGSTKGIGFALAEECARRGFNVVISGRDQQQVDAARDAVIERIPRAKISGRATDVTDPEQVQALWDYAVSRYRRVDIWVNNAGVANTTNAITDTKAADVSTMVTTNMLGTIHGCQVAARGFRDLGGGKLFNVLGGGSDGEYFPGMGVYGATKRGLDYLTRALVKELAGTGIVVGKIRPGMLITEGVLREIKTRPDLFEKSRRTMNILCDLPETVAPFIVDGMLAQRRSGGRIAWLSAAKISGRMLSARFRPRPDLFAGFGL